MKRKFTLLFSMLLLIGTESMNAEVVTSIGTLDQWKAFVTSVSNGDDYSSTTVTLTDDIVIPEESNFAATYMAGTSTHPFNGTFNGQGHKITYTKTGLSENVHGLFRYINGATIKNLRTAGTLTSSGTTMGGIVGQAHGNITIANCESSVTLTRTGSSDDDATYGGIVGLVGDNSTSWTMTIKNCIYNGIITVNKSGSGIVGYVRSNVTLAVSYCLFSGEIIYSANTNIANFTRGGSPSPTLTSCYYLNNYNSTGTAVTTAMRNNGELAYTLNTDNTESVFIGQGNLNKSNIEAWPSLTTEATKKVLKTKIAGMSTQPYVNPGGAVPNPVRFNLTGFKLNITDAYTLETMPVEGGEFVYGTTELQTTRKMYCITLPADYTTLILPFGVTTLPDGITAYNLSYTSGDNVTATPVSSISANKPVLISGTSGTRYKFTTDSDASYSASSGTNDILTGLFVDQGAGSGYNPIAYVPQNSYVLQKKGGNLGFYKVAEDNKVKITSFRAYATFSYSPGAREFLGIDFADNNPTGISTMSKSVEVKNNEYYNLSGQRVAQPQKGLYIVNGKKYVVK